MQTVYSNSLEQCRNIILPHEDIWSKKKIGETSKRLIEAMNFLRAVTAAVLMMNDPEEFIIHFRIGKYGTSYEKIIRSIRCTQYTSQENYKNVIANRHQLYYHLGAFLRLMESYFIENSTHPFDYAATVAAKFLKTEQEKLTNVSIEEDVNDPDFW